MTAAGVLGRVSVPSFRHYDPVLGTWMSTGDAALEIMRGAEWDQPVAVDIETPSVEDSFTIKCVTATWVGRDGARESVLLDPMRDGDHLRAAREMFSRARALVLHNAAFDVPGLVAAEIMTLADIDKVQDTLVYARLAYPDTFVGKSLGALSAKLLGLDEMAGGMEAAFAAAGYKNKAQGFREMDIDTPIYRAGAMADTAATLMVRTPLIDAAVLQLTDHPFDTHGLTERGQALELIEREQIVNRVMLRRSARGLAVDVEYLDRYRGEVEEELRRSELLLHNADIRPGNGGDLMAAIESAGELPENWPRTPTGRLKADKGNLEGLDHPLARAHREVAHGSKILGYLEKVVARSRVTGRLHPMVGVLGASATGRMAYSSPELQQFPAEARAIITDDGQGLTSVDWSQIEPVTLANMARDLKFVEPFEAGEDLYEPIQRAAGVDRKTAKVVLLGTMYGQGTTRLAATIGHTYESAAQIKRQLFAAMPESAKFMGRISDVASNHGCVPTLSGRILPIPTFNGERAAHKGVNYVVQGSALDVLHETIVAVERAGLGDHIQLAMHDELVVDTEVAREVEQIMQTPPEALCRWAGRVPILRTDRADMGSAWASV